MYQIEIIETGMNGHRTVIDTVSVDADSDASAFDIAVAKVNAMGAAYLEIDADYVHCADAFMNDGRILAIQPVGFKISKEDATKFAADRKAAADAFMKEFGL